MSWTYTPDFTTKRDQVRFLIQDTQSTRPLLSDQEIAWVVSTEANVYMAAAMCCDTLVAKAGNVKTRWIGDLRVTIDAAFYRGLANMLRARGCSHQVPFAGGISISDKQEQEQDTDAVQPRVFRTMLDNPRANQPSPGDQGGSTFPHVP